MTSLVAIGGGKQTVQRISTCFPKREGQSRIRILFLFSLARTLIKSCKDTLSGFAECLQVFVSPILHVLKHGERSVGKIRKSVGEFRNV